jgi:flagellin
MTRINTNVGSLIAQKTLSRTSDQLQTALTRLSTGLRINSGKDDPAGLIASENLRRDITSANTAITNSQTAGQLIATADSSLGQISGLLNDIRGLAVQAANKGVLSDDQIAANQLQVDASLEAIDRIAKVTTFQGRKLLAGSLDFSKTYTGGGATVADLSINSANLGTAGSLAVSVNITTGATQAALTDNAFGSATPTQASGTLTLTNGTLTISAKPGGAADGYVGDTTSIKLQAATGATEATGTSVGGAPINISAVAGGAADGIAGDSTSVVYQASAGIAQAATTATNLANSVGSIQVAAKSGGAFAGAAGNAVTVTYQADSAIVHGTGTVALTNTGETFDLTAVAGGAADGTKANTTTVVLQDATGANPTSAAYDANTNTLTVSVATGGTVGDITAAIDADGTFTTSNTSNANTAYVNTDNGNTSYTSNGDGVDGTTTASITGNAITVKVAANGTLADVKSAIDGLNAGADFTTTVTNSGNKFKASDFAAATTGGTLAGGSNGTTSASYASGTITVNVALGDTNANVATAINNLADFNATNTGSGAFNTANFGTTANALSGGADATTGASYDATANAITVNVGTGATIDDIKAAVNSLADFTATDTNGTNLIAAGDETTHPAGTLTGGVGNGLAADLVVRIGGDKGSEVFNFRQGATVSQVVNAINLVSDGTGVQASNNSGVLNLKSTSYGSAGLVDVEVLSEGSGGTFGSSLSATRATGTDVVATVNGATASGKGNTLSVHTATLDLALTVSNGSSTAVNFNITGGGAVFQLGPNVVTNQQARIGIGSVNTGTLGGTDGRLYELRSGYGKDLATNPNGATLVVDEAINKVTSLRGRLGAFQKTTIDTNINSLKDTVTNLTQAESQIRDADFAAETAALTRAQVLTQSGTQVLAIANQQPQNVLSLLRNL